MNKVRKGTDIIERIEYIRNYLGLNKSRFSSEIGLKPQTYNNFIGAQSSKPSVELILGIENRFGVNPNWILNGKPPVFQEWTPEQERRLGAGMPLASGSGWGPHGAEPTDRPGRPGEPEDLERKVEQLADSVRTLERRLDAVEGGIAPDLRDLSDLLVKLQKSDPATVENEIETLKVRLQQLIDRQSSR